MKIISNITQSFCHEVAKRARKGRVAGISFAIFAALAVTLYAQSRGTPSTLRIKIDSTGALAVSSAAITNPITTVVFNNARLAVDSNGYLLVTDGSGAGFAPANATYIVKTANASLSSAQSLGVLTTAALINTVSGSTGTLSAYSGVTCSNSVLTALSAILGGTCSTSVQLTNLTLTGFLTPSEFDLGSNTIPIKQSEPTPVAPTTALAGAGAGNVDNGTHVYRETCITPTGESIASSSSSSINVVDKTTNGKVTVTLSYCSGVATGRNLYRSKAGTSTPLFLIAASPMVGNNFSTAVYTDNVADASLQVTTAPTTTATNDSHFYFNSSGGPSMQGGFCFNSSKSSCLYYFASNILMNEGRLWFSDSTFNNGRTNDNNSIYGRIEGGGGGMGFIGINGTIPVNPSLDFIGMTSDPSSFPAITLAGGYNSNGALGPSTAASFPYTGRLLEVCYTTYGHPCDVWGGSATLVSGVDQSNSGFLELLGSGQLLHRVWGVAITIPIGTTERSSFVEQNPVAATSGAQVQYSPSIDLCGSAWNSASEYDCWRFTNRPAAANPTTSIFAFRSSINGGAFTDRFTLSSAGLATATTFNANSKSTYGATSDKLTQINDNANATGMEINVGTPTLGTCTGGTMVSGSHNFGGEVTGNTSGSCVINFGTPNFTNTPFCMINDEGSLTAARVSARSASSITVTGVPSGEAFQFMCFGRIGT